MSAENLLGEEPQPCWLTAEKQSDESQCCPLAACQQNHRQIIGEVGVPEVFTRKVSKWSSRLWGQVIHQFPWLEDHMTFFPQTLSRGSEQRPKSLLTSSFNQNHVSCTNVHHLQQRIPSIQPIDVSAAALLLHAANVTYKMS